LKETLYVKRPVLNGQDIVDHLAAHGIGSVPPNSMHVTIAYSRTPVDWNNFFPSTTRIHTWNWDVSRCWERFDSGAIVLVLHEPILNVEHDRFMKGGCSYDYPEYRPHITVRYDDETQSTDIEKIPPYNGVIRLGPEEFMVIMELSLD
jgi:hypothetical protein